MNDDDLLLATAYLDGELGADDRARVEADPELLALVDEQHQVRSLLADVEPPSIARREEQLAAALDAWDRVPSATRTGDGTPAGVAAISTPPPSSSDRRSVDWNRRLLGAAAAMIVVVGAGVALQTFTSIDSDDGSATDAGAETLERADDAEGETPAAQNAPAAADDQAELATEGTIDVGSDNASPPRESDLENLRNAQDLAIFASDAIGAPVSDIDASATGGSDDVADGELVEDDLAAAAPEIELPLCLGADLLVGPARYQEQVVVVGIDESRSLALAYLPESCTEIARASVPADGP